ncbi:hypothetical protein EDB81DRAFT_893025 [Dactylonectria macrodidyma]|uniref:FAD-binding domain-containing protein n=1 Tax=Dactylonectria macrodidyma TaxID=307937 RepID=A0A9P9ICI8_9HYPO|nr:hypothetical protein EDB81DRAFT_893025 [Dactylonectria macrodidyma]
MAGTTKPFKVIIVGSGLAGSLLANGLINNDVEVAVYERLDKDVKREGYQIRLGAPALIGMRANLEKDHLSRIVEKFGRAGGAKSSAPSVYDEKFNRLIDFRRFAAYSKSAPINRVILRDALAKPVDKAGKLHYGRSFSRYEILKPGTQDEQVRVYFSDETYDDCDVLVGADGSHSKINKQIGLNNIADVPRYISLIAKSDLPASTFAKMSPGLRQGPVAAFADRKPLYFAVYLPDKIDASGHVDNPNTTLTNGTNFDEGVSSCMFAVHFLENTVPPNLARLSREEKWDVASSALRGWSDEYHEMIDLVRSTDPYILKGRASVRPARNWRRKVASSTEPERGHPRVWMLGDAMHAMLPNRGMGGNQAMQDTATILPLLTKLASQPYKPSTQDIERAGQEYEDEMIPRAFTWVAKSGGSNFMPIDSSTFTGRLLFQLAGILLHVIAIWSTTKGWLFGNKDIDDAPELQS